MFHGYSKCNGRPPCFMYLYQCVAVVLQLFCSCVEFVLQCAHTHSAMVGRPVSCMCCSCVAVVPLRGMVPSLITVQHSATHCNTLQHTATRCNTPPHATTHMFHAALQCPNAIARNEDDHSDDIHFLLCHVFWWLIDVLCSARVPRHNRTQRRRLLWNCRCLCSKCARAASHKGVRAQGQGRYCCSVLQCVAVCCSVLQCVAIRCSVLQCVMQFSTPSRNMYVRKGKVVSVVVCCSVLQCVAVCCSVLQCVAVCCSVLQCVAVCCSVFYDSSKSWYLDICIWFVQIIYIYVYDLFVSPLQGGEDS